MSSDEVEAEVDDSVCKLEVCEFETYQEIVEREGGELNERRKKTGISKSWKACYHLAAPGDRSVSPTRAYNDL